MLLHLHLTNFQKHENLRLDFGSGLHLLKGANEAGKSTLMRAAVYALFGARALPLPLSETVTWGKPESSLKVELGFRHDNVDYTIRRGKSGAELLSDGLRVSGQSEVTSFVERLLGVSAGLASKLMLSNQSSLQGALTDGTAVSLIERLADFDLLETIVDKIQTHYATGNTTALEQQIAKMATAKPEQPDTASLEIEWSVLLRNLDTLKANEATLTANLAELDTKQAASILNAAADIHSQKKVHSDEHARIRLLLTKPVPAKPEKDFAQAQAAVEQYKKNKADWEAYTKFVAAVGLLHGEEQRVVPVPVLKWFSDGEARLSQALRTEKANADKVALSLKLAEQRLIQSGTCQWCQMDLTDVPAVSVHNTVLLTQIEDMKVSLAHHEAAMVVIQADLNEHQRLRKLTEGVGAHMQGLDRVAYEKGTVPGVYSWVGDIPQEPGPSPEGDYTRLAAAWFAYNQAEQEQAQAATRERELVSKVAQLDEELKALPVADAQETIALAQSYKGQITRTSRQLADTSADVASLETRLAVLDARYKEALAHWQAGQGSVAELQATLVDTRFNNHVVKRIREVRPEVAARLWAAVLQSVSQLFSSVRGVPSTVVREGTDFLVDGHSAKGLSGSTLDSLGLAIRLGLVKTFLPSVRFLLIDEPAAGMDEQREAAMLAMLSTCDLEQVVMITHSNLADSFATNITEI